MILYEYVLKFQLWDSWRHRKRINTEEKADLVTAALGRFEEKDEFILFFKSS